MPKTPKKPTKKAAVKKKPAASPVKKTAGRKARPVNALVSPEAAITHYNDLLSAYNAEDIRVALRATKPQIVAMLEGKQIRQSTEKRILALTPQHLDGELPIEYSPSGQGNGCGICKLQDASLRDKVDKLLVGGNISCRAVSRQVFGNETRRESIATHARHTGMELAVNLQEVQEKNGLKYAEKFASVFEKAEKMLNALDAELTDPTDDTKYTLAYREEDVQVLWDKPVFIPISDDQEDYDREKPKAKRGLYLITEEDRPPAPHGWMDPEAGDPRLKDEIKFKVEYERTLSSLPEILEYLEERDVGVAKIRVAPKNFHDVFLRTVQRLEPLLKQLGEAQQVFKPAITDSDLLRAQKDWMLGIFMLFMDFNLAKGRGGDTMLELLLYFYRQQSESIVLRSLITDEKQSLNANLFTQTVESVQTLLMPHIETEIKDITPKK